MSETGPAARATGTASGQGLLTVERPLEFVQWAAIAGSLVVAIWSIPGLIVNPDFAIGDDATSELVLGVDMNGWHALSGFLVTIPGLFAATRRDLSAVFCAAAAGALIATGIWALIEAHALGGLFYFPNGTGDALLHFATSAIFVAGAVSYFGGARRTDTLEP
jgi:hypothetical protein